MSLAPKYFFNNKIILTFGKKNEEENGIGITRESSGKETSNGKSQKIDKVFTPPPILNSNTAPHSC
jgi:hypothetical protein